MGMVDTGASVKRSTRSFISVADLFEALNKYNFVLGLIIHAHEFVHPI